MGEAGALGEHVVFAPERADGLLGLGELLFDADDGVEVAAGLGLDGFEPLIQPLVEQVRARDLVLEAVGGVVDGGLALSDALAAALEVLHAAVEVILLGLVAGAFVAAGAFEELELGIDHHLGVLDALEEATEGADLFLHGGEAECLAGELADLRLGVAQLFVDVEDGGLGLFALLADTGDLGLELTDLILEPVEHVGAAGAGFVAGSFIVMASPGGAGGRRGRRRAPRCGRWRRAYRTRVLRAS